MILKLPDVTLVAVDTYAHALTRAAVQDCMMEAEFGDVMVFTDAPVQGLAAGHQVQLVGRKIDSGEAAERFFWERVPYCIETSHFMWVQWDSWITDADMWTDEFLAYDYIGAPWWYDDGRNVGNGGFSLRSARLARYVADRPGEFPFRKPEDDTLCRVHRPALEAAGFRWAPEPLAMRFAFECVKPSLGSRHFGFHGVFNWPWVLTPLALKRRFALAPPKIVEFCRRPDIAMAAKDATCKAAMRDRGILA